MTIGVLALQGAVREHLEMIENCGARGEAVKLPSGLNGINGLIIPGGESTTIGKLIDKYDFTDSLIELGVSGVPVFGTCAGLIVLAGRVLEGRGPTLGLADVTVKRNAFGRQVDSFEQDILISGIEDQDRPFRAVFIRAPVITEVGSGVEIMADLEDGIVMARDRNYLIGAFHPELTGDRRVHQYFINMVLEARMGTTPGLS
ncbi:MAG: pyridoxal 5'-phosphate synthase glutaminase subunit PdxT [Actinobacteria bacterium]|nr:pyridoxal 5'-phosphate synthase glutaminase subunit PdxT [Actinomycetota bacterium]